MSFSVLRIAIKAQTRAEAEWAIDWGTEDEMKRESRLRNMSEWHEVDLALDFSYTVHKQPDKSGFSKQVRDAALTPSVNSFLLVMSQTFS